MKPRLGSSNEDGAMLLGNAGFQFDGSASILAGGGKGAVFTSEDKAVVFNSAQPAAAVVQQPQYPMDGPIDGPAESLGSPGDSGSSDGNDGSSGVAW